MPVPTFKPVNPDEVRANIKAIIGDKKLNEFTVKHSTILEDYVKLAVLMTDAKSCYDNLAVLNERLTRKIESEKVGEGLQLQTITRRIATRQEGEGGRG